MTSVNRHEHPLGTHEIEIRVRYQETDAQGRVHHGNYLTYFEMGRVELLRSAGHSYKHLEEAGVMLVVSHAEVKFHHGAEYDDVLRLRTETVRARGARIEHRYRLTRDETLIAEGRTIVASIDRNGKICRLPEWLQVDFGAQSPSTD